MRRKEVTCEMAIRIFMTRRASVWRATCVVSGRDHSSSRRSWAPTVTSVFWNSTVTSAQNASLKAPFSRTRIGCSRQWRPIGSRRRGRPSIPNRQCSPCSTVSADSGIGRDGAVSRICWDGFEFHSVTVGARVAESAARAPNSECVT